MIFIAPGDDDLVPKGDDRFKVPETSRWRNIEAMFNRRLADSRLPQLTCKDYNNFVLCAALPQTLSSRVALSRNMISMPDTVHYLNRKCGHCLMLSKELPRSRVVWLNRGEAVIPDFVRRAFSDVIPVTASTTPSEFFSMVPFPHTRATARLRAKETNQ